MCVFSDESQSNEVWLKVHQVTRSLARKVDYQGLQRISGDI